MSKCELCDQPANHHVADAREVEPQTDEKGQKWRRCEKDGETHYFCDQHARPSRQTLLERSDNE